MKELGRERERERVSEEQTEYTEALQEKIGSIPLTHSQLVNWTRLVKELRTTIVL